MKKQSRRQLLIGAGVAGAVILLAVAVFLYIYFEKRVYKSCAVEAGTPVAASDFVRFDRDKHIAAFKYGTSVYDVQVPGEYPIEVQLGNRVYKSKLTVTDTIAPQVVASPKKTMYSIPLQPEDFIVEIKDQTTCTVAFQSEPDFRKTGDQDITLVITDMGGNVSTMVTQVNVIGIYPEISMEAGSPRPTTSDFAFAEKDAALLTPLSDIDMNLPGDYIVSFSVQGIQYDSILHLRDTVPPTAEGIHYEGFACYPRTPMELLEGLTDATAVDAEFVDDPMFDQPGERDVQIRLVDMGGNEQIVTSHINLIADEEPPVIEGTKDISVITNQAIAYKDHVTVTDNADPNITYTVDNSAVDLATEGVYPVIYTATDGAGNTTTIEIKVTVVYRPYTEDDVWALCDDVLKNILKDGMSEKEIVEAIFNWVDWTIMYKGHAEKVSWIQGAYDGLKNHSGDCFTIACTCYALYTRAGIENFIIERYPVTYAQHFWNAVKIDGVWYHCDALTKDDGTRFFMWDSTRLKNYSDSHRGYHYYDASKYDVQIP
ncbi:MAG: transglutaminase domain-containing protein [Clostridiales bacterium]|nr:transglutaminase domain-containing protein [Clostridiales bacterium]